MLDQVFEIDSEDIPKLKNLIDQLVLFEDKSLFQYENILLKSDKFGNTHTEVEAELDIMAIVGDDDNISESFKSED